MQDKQGALDTLTREELGIDPAELGVILERRRHLIRLVLCGCHIPGGTVLLAKGHWAIARVVIASGAVLCAVGMLTSLFNGRSAWYSALRQLVFGCLAAAVTYGIGAALGTLQLAS